MIILTEPFYGKEYFIKKLFLASYSNLVIDNISELISTNPSNLSLAFIPTARDPYHITETFDPEKEKLRSMGFNIKIVDIKNTSKEQLRKKLKNIDVIFIAGGNTFYLLDQANKSGFTELAKELVDKGVIYIGSSAGSVLAGPDISIIEQFDDPGAAPSLKSTKGLGLVDFIVLPHFGEENYKDKTEEVYEKWKHGDIPIIPINNKQAIIVEGESHRIVEAKED